MRTTRNVRRHEAFVRLRSVALAAVGVLLNHIYATRPALVSAYQGVYGMGVVFGDLHARGDYAAQSMGILVGGDRRPQQ